METKTRVPIGPPARARRLLKNHCPGRWLEEVEGDLEEVYGRTYRSRGRILAALVYWKEVVLFCLWHGFRNVNLFDWSGSPGMIKNYIVVAMRNLGRNLGYTLINTFGLAIGMACYLLILMLVQHERSYDTFHANRDDIYRVVIEQIQTDGSRRYRNLIPSETGETIQKTYPAVVRYSNYVYGHAPMDLIHRDQTFGAKMAMGDSSFFELFSFPLLAGDPSTALDDLSAIVLTRETAVKVFGERPLDRILGESLDFPYGDTTFTFTVTGIAASVPEASSLQFDAVIPERNNDRIYIGGNDWGGHTSLYLQLARGQDPAALEKAFMPAIQRDFAERIRSEIEAGNQANRPDAFRFHLQPFSRLHLDPTISVDYEVNPHNPLYSYILSGIALLVLVIACINFVILSVGRSVSRSKEVGMRKVMGAEKGQVMLQFWGEAFILTLAAMLVSLAFIVPLLPLFNDLTGKHLALSGFLEPGNLGMLGGLLLGVALLTGGYPAAVLSRFQPVVVLKGTLKTRAGRYLSRSLVVVQYTISIALLVSTLIMGQQLDYMLNRNLGYDRQHVVVVHTHNVCNSEAPQLIERFRNKLAPHREILKIARTGYSFTRGGDQNTWTDQYGVSRRAWNFGIDYDYLDVMGIRMARGRNFSREHPSDPTTAVLVNEALVRQFGLRQPLGHRLVGWGDGYMENPPVIIGVVKDFNYQSLHEEVRPAVMNMHPGYYNGMGAMLIKVDGKNLAGTVRLIETTWGQMYPGKPFSYSFLDDDISRQYLAEQQWSKILTYSSICAVLIACLGLFGLATLTVTKRTKEIGIRKVMGASVTRIVGLLSGDFVRLVLIAGVLSAPVAYLAMRQWLGSFAYRIDIGPLVFLGAAGLAVTVALVTVSVQTIRAALSDPVRSLRYE